MLKQTVQRKWQHKLKAFRAKAIQTETLETFTSHRILR